MSSTVWSRRGFISSSLNPLLHLLMSHKDLFVWREIQTKIKKWIFWPEVTLYWANVKESQPVFMYPPNSWFWTCFASKLFLSSSKRFFELTIHNYQNKNLLSDSLISKVFDTDICFVRDPNFADEFGNFRAKRLLEDFKFEEPIFSRNAIFSAGTSCD